MSYGDAELGKEDFLTLLVAQLQNQDPLNPMDDKEFTSQLAEFSSLEQLTNISEGIDSLNDSYEQQHALTAVSYIGTEVVAEGSEISKTNSSISTLYFDLEEAVSNCYVNLFDSSGNLVHTVELGSMTAGNYELTWDGLDYEGKELSNGVYTASMAAENADGEPVMVYTDVSGVVSGVVTEGDDLYLRLEDGRFVDFMSVTEVVGDTTAATGSSTQ
jgi:flagellar basal-body rod modification protein FlgD